MRKKMPDSGVAHVNVVPMVDVIMCLIIFYMLAAKIGVDTGEDEKIAIPVGLLGKELKSMENTILVNVAEEMSTASHGSKLGTPTGRPVVTAMVETGGQRVPLVLDDTEAGQKLVDILRRLRFGKDGKKGGSGENADNAEMKLIIRGNYDMSFFVLQKVLLSASKAEIKTINFQTSTSDDPMNR